MFCLFYGPEPFFRFGSESVPVYLTGIRLCTRLGASRYQHVNKIISRHFKNMTQSTSIAHNITSSKNREHSLFKYTINVVHHSIIHPCLLLLQRLRVE
jgi:hypothetical protein